MVRLFNHIFYRVPVGMLLFIKRSPKPVRQVELSRHLHTHVGNVVKVLRKLEKANLIRSLSLGERKNSKSYMLTARGASVADELLRIRGLIGNGGRY